MRNVGVRSGSRLAFWTSRFFLLKTYQTDVTQAAKSENAISRSMDTIVIPNGAREKSRGIFSRDIITVRMGDFLLKSKHSGRSVTFPNGIYTLFTCVHIENVRTYRERTSLQHTRTISPSILSSVIQSPRFNCMLRETSRREM